ncbi:MAG: hypothetical protein M3Q06_02215 [Bacteroidota bacterium]|nr:hypothetical protein [Bacteroidota bacterium]
MSNPKPYTAADIERYHRGGMTAAEMHQLEKAALDDPMLADALEGYRYSPSASSEMESLQRRLEQRVGDEKKKDRAFWLQPWVRVAALFILLAGGGWLAFQTLTANNSNLATNNPAAATSQPQNETARTDSAPPALQQSPAFSYDSTGTTDVAILKKKNEPVSRQIRSTTPSVPPTAMGKPADAGNQSAMEVPSSREATPNRMMTMKTEAPQAATREQADAPPKGQDMPKRRIVTDTAQSGVVAATQSRESRFAVDSSAQPEGGWTAFEEYIVKNRKPQLPLNKRGATPQAVELSFAIDKNGRPINIVVTSSHNKESDEEAIRLLKGGPRWKGRTGNVRIPFTQ